jgi:hypothetical protein
MENVTNTIKLRIDDQYALSLAQGSITNMAEVALTHKRDGAFLGFVNPLDWCLDWVGEDYNDDVIAGCDAHDVLDLLQLAKQYVYTKENR